MREPIVQKVIFTIIFAFAPAGAMVVFATSTGQGQALSILYGLLFGFYSLAMLGSARLSDSRAGRSSVAMTFIFNLTSMIIIVLVLNLFAAIQMNHEHGVGLRRLWTLIAIVGLLSVFNYIAAEILIRRETDDSNGFDYRPHLSAFRPATNSATGPRSLELYRRAATWALTPLATSLAITLITYHLSSYEGTVVNHATIFGVYLAVAVVVKQKAEEITSRRSDPK